MKISPYPPILCVEYQLNIILGFFLNKNESLNLIFSVRSIWIVDTIMPVLCLTMVSHQENSSK